MPVAGLVSGGLNVVGGLVKGLIGGGQKRKGKKLLNSLQFPEEQIQQEVLQNQALAKQQAATGMPSEQYAQAMKNIQRTQLTALRGAQDRRGGIGAIASIQQGTNDATLNLDAQNAKMRVDNEGRLMDVNNQVAGWKSKLFDVNKRQKYQRDYGYAMGLIGSGNQNIMSGIDQGTAGVGSALMGGFKGGSNYTGY